MRLVDKKPHTHRLCRTQNCNLEGFYGHAQTVVTVLGVTKASADTIQRQSTHNNSQIGIVRKASPFHKRCRLHFGSPSDSGKLEKAGSSVVDHQVQPARREVALTLIKQSKERLATENRYNPIIESSEGLALRRNRAEIVICDGWRAWRGLAPSSARRCWTKGS